MNSIMQTLKRETWECHQRLEGKLNLFDPTFTSADYRGLLEKFLGYYRPFENQLKELAGLGVWMPDLDRRLKTALLEADLIVLGVAAEELTLIQSCQAIPKVDSVASAFGCLYVLEGSTLGGQFLYRHFSQSLGIRRHNGGGFFHGYGDETEAMWRTFGEGLAAAVSNFGGLENAVVASAQATFDSLEAWLCREC